MILRKPYAFLIKYFQKINIVLLGFILFLFYKTMKFSQFTKNYLSTNIYNSKIDSISNYFNGYTALAFICTIIISIILIYLLRKKDKPYFSYVFILSVNFFNFILLIYCNNFFTYKAMDGFNLQTARAINDLSSITNILYYPLIIILLIRAIGIDLKSFGFQEDKEVAEIEDADREEVEVNVGFDKEKWLRNFKYYFRNTKYFIVEHKVSLACVFGIVFLIAFFQFYNYFYVENKIYGMNKNISANNYDLKVKNVYLTDKDYRGNIITNDNKYFIIVDLQIKNKLNSYRLFDIEKALLYINNDYYVPTTRYNQQFKDMGNLYIGKEINPRETVSYLLIYEVPKPDSKANFVLKYQDVGNVKLVQVKIKILDISTFKTKGEETYPNNFEIAINNEEKVNCKIEEYEIMPSINYTYKSCNSNGNCPIFQETYQASAGSNVLHLKFDVDDAEIENFINFVHNYGKVRYKIDDTVKEVNADRIINRDYRGSHVYIVVPEEIKNASNIDLVFTVRTYQHIYHLKGE